MRKPLPSFIRVWFVLDLVIALLPPVHSMAAGATPVLGMPRVQTLWPVGIPWAYGLTSGAVALVANLAVYVSVALVTRRTPIEKRRLDALFAGADLPDARARGATRAPRNA